MLDLMGLSLSLLALSARVVCAWAAGHLECPHDVDP